MTPEERLESFEISLHIIRDILAETAAMNLKTEAALRRAIRLAVREARHERQRRREGDDRLKQLIVDLDQLITKLAATQVVTEEKLQRFLDSRSHHNGDSK